MLELENEKLRKSLEVLQRIVDAKNEEIDNKNGLLHKLLEKGFSQPPYFDPRETAMRDNVEDLDIDSLLQANLGDGEVNFDILDLSVTGTFFQSEDGNDFYEDTPVDLVKTNKDKTSALPNRDDSNTTRVLDKPMLKSKEDPTVIQRIAAQQAAEDQAVIQKKVTPLKISVVKRERACEDKFEAEASLAKKRRIDFSSSVGCPHCDLQFPLGGQWKLKKHILQEHKDRNERQALRCEICEKIFSSQSVFVSHSEMHRAETPLDCNLCKSRFGELPLLVEHAKTEHSFDNAEQACKILLS